MLFMSKKRTWEEKKERVNEITERMEKAIQDHFTTPEQMKEYLTFMSKFYDYSLGNSSLL